MMIIATDILNDDNNDDNDDYDLEDKDYGGGIRIITVIDMTILMTMMKILIIVKY